MITYVGAFTWQGTLTVLGTPYTFSMQCGQPGNTWFVQWQGAGASGSGTGTCTPFSQTFTGVLGGPCLLFSTTITVTG